MLQKRQRADRKTVEKIFSAGKFAGSANLSLKYLFEPGKRASGISVSFVAPKSAFKKATERNLLRRRGYSAARKLLPLFPDGFRGVFMIKKSKLDMEKEINSLLKKIK